jgi:glycosyltransferase involved in cell wall biosynthesis
MIRVGFVLHVMQVAGAEVLVYETIQRLAGRIEPSVICLDSVGQLGERLLEQGVPVVGLGRRPGIDWRLFGRMAREIRERKLDVVHAHQYTPFFYSSVAARRSGLRPRVIFTEHGRHFPDVVSRKRRLLNRILFDRLADEVTAVCEFSARSLAVNDGFDGSRIRVVPNGIEVDRYRRQESPRELRTRLGWPVERRYVTSVARFHPVKDHATLINAFATVARTRSDVDLMLAGDGELRENLERQVETLGLAGRVRFLGVRRDVPDVLMASDVFTLSSLSEASSLTLLEAMASGLPVVVTDVGGNPELVRRGVDGLLVPRRDPVALGAALLRLLNDPALSASMGRAASARVAEEFDLGKTIDRYAALYQENARSTVG